MAINELLEQLLRGAELVDAAVAGLSEGEADYLPGNGKWTVRQVVSHLADSEMVGADRFRRVLAEDNPTLMAYDEKAWAEKLDWGRRSIPQSLELFRKVRQLNYELLKDLPEAAFERQGRHSERGPLRVAQLLEIYAQHAEGHARQIRAARESYRQAQARG